MRLLDSRTLTFKEFERDDSIPEYAIFSHTWEGDEVTCKEMRKNRTVAESKKGFRKIDFCAKQARKDRLDYFWIDTCCIDKSSSAELSEAINSMFRWYQNAQVCYAFLADTPPAPAHKSPEVHDIWTKKFKSSRWFTRGWTLQELIAPRTLVFYSQEGTVIGTKTDLGFHIEACTGVPYDVLEHGDVSGTSLAQRMSWAAQRSTSRTEDMAYCLMGLFDVYMPMLYGEGQHAFIRLQEEIIKNSDDMSIFSWVDPNASFSTYRGLLARSPSEFAQCKNVRWVRTNNPPYQITNKGIRIESLLKPRATESTEYMAPLLGVTNKDLHRGVIGIYLQQVGEDQYARVDPERLAIHSASTINDARGSLATFFVRQNVVMESLNHSRAAGVSLQLTPSTLALVDVQPSARWNTHTRFFSFDSQGNIRQPPRAVFSIHDPADSDGIVITVDASKNWGEFVEVSKGWNTNDVGGSSPHRMFCRRPDQRPMEIIVERGLFSDESKIMLSVIRHANKW